MKEMFKLKGKVAIVTGGNGGIGLGISRGLASAGCDIVIAARNQSKTASAVEDIKAAFDVQVMGIQTDVQDESQIMDMVQQKLDNYGRIDTLVNNAGISIAKMPQNYDSAEWDKVLDINLKSAFLCSKAVYPAMKKAGGGKIICIGSILSIFGAGPIAAYCASKGGIVQLARSLAVAWAPKNIQVNAILPGWIRTDMTSPIQNDLPEWNKNILARTPGGRWGEPDDLAGAAVFLASPASDFVTGVALPVDGGYAVCGIIT
jgi:2-deoxy-D-gluconate 3-dehydrogenase